MQCKECGIVNAENSFFCRKCGRRLKLRTFEKVSIVIILIVCLIVGLLCGIKAYRGSKSNIPMLPEELTIDNPESEKDDLTNSEDVTANEIDYYNETEYGSSESESQGSTVSNQSGEKNSEKETILKEVVLKYFNNFNNNYVTLKKYCTDRWYEYCINHVEVEEDECSEGLNNFYAISLEMIIDLKTIKVSQINIDDGLVTVKANFSLFWGESDDYYGECVWTVKLDQSYDPPKIDKITLQNT